MKALNRFVFEGRRIDAELRPFSERKVVGVGKVKVRDTTLPLVGEGYSGSPISKFVNHT